MKLSAVKELLFLIAFMTLILWNLRNAKRKRRVSVGLLDIVEDMDRKSFVGGIVLNVFVFFLLFITSLHIGYKMFILEK